MTHFQWLSIHDCFEFEDSEEASLPVGVLVAVAVTVPLVTLTVLVATGGAVEVAV